VYTERTIFLRVMLMIGQMVLFTKFQYYLSLVDNIAPLINVFFKIFYDISGIMIVIVLLLWSSAFSFYILAQNQINFDNLSDEDMGDLPYGTLKDSLNYMGNMMIGETDEGPFTLGDAKMEVPLFILFWICAFTSLIHLLNMLIAIMGNTFEAGNQTQEQQKYKEHLSFVVDNWFLRSYAFENIEQAKYIITTFSAVEDEENDPVFQEIRDEIVVTTGGISTQLKKQDDKIKDIQRMMTKVLKRMDPDG
jgi:hypothetical protein